MNAAPELERVIVVLGARAHEILAAVDFGRAEPIICEGWSEGIAASIRCAARSLSDADPLVIAVGDQPGLTPHAVGAVVRASLGDPGRPPARAVYAGVPGHPVAIPSSIRDAVMRLRGDRGASGLLGGAVEVECGAAAAGLDVDTVLELQALTGHGHAGRGPRPS